MPHTLSRRAFERFDELVELPHEQQQLLLEKLRQTDPSLFAEVDRLLKADAKAATVERTEDRLAHWASELASVAPFQPTAVLQPGQTIASWHILSPLGQGGMGTVWLAERKGDGYTQKAALKLISFGVDTPASRERFLRERGILAQLDHPNIAALLEGGVSPEGLLYFAMAYVEGSRIDVYCDEHRLPIRDRVRIFLQVLDAVQYAHRNLIVHRDLKPANVMVDQDGHAKLLDFGIAKLLEEGNNALTRDTAMTPQYAAPEQLLGKPITTATDIYQLGLMLHTLLVGGHPFGVTNDTPITALLRTLGNAPLRLSEAARTLASESIALRNASRAELIKRVSGDLSAIVSTCIAREPEHRYHSVDALASDLRCWLDGHAVSVRASSRSYRMRQFFRRYRWPIAATASIICALAVGLGIAVQQAQEARLQAARAEQVKSLVLSVFREQDPLLRDANAQRTPAQVIAAGIANLRPEFFTNPKLRGELLSDLGEIQGNLGDPDGGRQSLEKALALRIQYEGRDSLGVMQTERKLAQLAISIGDKEGATGHANNVIATASRLHIPHSVDAARAKLALGFATINSDKREHALELAREAISDLSTTLGKTAPDTIEARFRYAQFLVQARQEEDAITELQQVLDAITTTSGKDSARLISPLATLGGALRQGQHLQEAAKAYEQLIALSEKHYSGKNKLLASGYSRYGILLLELNHIERAQALFEKAEQTLPAGENIELAQLLSNRTKAYIALKQADAAEAAGRRAFELRHQGMGDNDGLAWYFASQWGSTLALQGKLHQAETVQRDALARLRKIIGANAYQNVLILDALGDTLHLQKRFSEEVPLRRESLEITATKYDAKNQNYIDRLSALQQAEQALAKH